MNLVIYPNPLLRRETLPLKHVGRCQRQVLRQMLRHMRRWGGIGLAAPQVGLLEQFIVAETEGETILWANPQILERNGVLEWADEGCLSLPQTCVSVERSARIWVCALNMRGRKIERKLEGLLARIVQHEVDHLHGVLIIDHKRLATASPKNNTFATRRNIDYW